MVSTTPEINLMSTPIMSVDLTRRPPRSMRVRLGGFVILARMLHKGPSRPCQEELNIITIPLLIST